MKRLLREIRERAWLWWWWLCTGDASQAATRRRIEEEARRFGGEVRWQGDGRPVFDEP